jgi:hypothetical protein
MRLVGRGSPTTRNASSRLDAESRASWQRGRAIACEGSLPSRLSQIRPFTGLLFVSEYEKR